MKGTIVLLSKERRRRTVTLVSIVLLSLVYFYEYPLYLLLYLYDHYHNLGGLDSHPFWKLGDSAYFSACAIILFYVFKKPKNYIKVSASKPNISVYHQGKYDREVLRADLNILEFKTYYERQKHMGPFIGHTRIHCPKHKDIVFYDSISTRAWWFEKRLAKNISAQLNGVKWNEKSEMLTKNISPKRERRIRKREEQRDKISAKIRKSPPEKIVNAYSTRIIIIILSGGFGFACWFGGVHMVAWIMFAFAILFFIDLVLTVLGYGQKANSHRQR